MTWMMPLSASTSVQITVLEPLSTTTTLSTSMSMSDPCRLVAEVKSTTAELPTVAPTTC